MNAGERRRIDRLEDSVHKVFTELGRFPVRFPHESAQSSYGTIKGIVRADASETDNEVALWDIELLHRAAPAGVKLGEQTDAGTFVTRNIFRQTWTAGDIAVAFETQGDAPEVEVSPGLANDDAGDLASLSAGDLAGRLAYSQADVTGALWWAFKPGGVGTGVSYFEITEDFALTANEVQAKPVLLDGSRDDSAQTVYLLDDDHEATRFEGLKAYTDEDDAATAHAGYRYFGYFVTDNYQDTGLAAYRIIDGEGPLDRIVVQLADGDSVSSGTTKVRALGDYDAGHPDNGRFPKLTGQASPGAGGGGYFEAENPFALFVGEQDSTTKYLVAWNVGTSSYIFLQKMASETTDEHAFFRTTSTIPAAVENAGPEIELGEGTGQRWVLKQNETKIYELVGQTTKLFNMTGQTIANQADVQCKKIDGQWWVDVEECPS